jgi:hypothetical protein
MDTAEPGTTPLPSGKSGRPPPTLAKFCASAALTELGVVKTLECEQLKIIRSVVNDTTRKPKIEQCRYNKIQFATRKLFLIRVHPIYRRCKKVYTQDEGERHANSTHAHIHIHTYTYTWQRNKKKKNLL